MEKIKKIRRDVIINGKEVSLKGPATDRFLDVLRAHGFKSIKEGCGEGICGACSIILNGHLINSCLMLFGQVKDGDKIINAEHEDELISKIRTSFLDAGAVQCGFCTPGMIMAAYALLSKNKSPTEDEIKLAMSGNLCRCTGYVKIVEGIKEAVTNKS